MKLPGARGISHDECEGKSMKQLGKEASPCVNYWLGFQGVHWQSGLKWNGFVLLWLILKHLLRGFQTCHVANIAQNFFFFENLVTCLVHRIGTFLDLLFLSLPQI